MKTRNHFYKQNTESPSYTKQYTTSHFSTDYPIFSKASEINKTPFTSDTFSNEFFIGSILHEVLNREGLPSTPESIPPQTPLNPQTSDTPLVFRNYTNNDFLSDSDTEANDDISLNSDDEQIDPTETSSPPTQRDIFEQSLIAWEEDPFVTGKKEEAARLIQHAYDCDQTELNLSGKELSSLPDCIGNITSLTHLYIDNNQLTSLPDSISLLSSLEHLYLQHNRFSTLPESITNIRSLTHLSIDNNQLTSLPDSISLLSSLDYLSLKNNRFSTLPESITNIRSLILLSIDNNQLTSLPNSISLLSSLAYLTLQNNLFSTLPESITNIRSLTHLFIDNNRLTSLPNAISLLSSLKSLSLQNNLFSTLPESITNIRSLTHLFIDNNRLTSLPNAISNLTALSFLCISDNSELRELPLSLGNIQTLRHLSAEHTHISNETVSAILSQCISQQNPEIDIPLAAKISNWQAYAKQTENRTNSSSFLASFSIRQKQSLLDWLKRLERTRDFNMNQADLTNTVCAMLETLETNEDFKEIFFIQVEENLERCEDRAAMSLNEIYTSWKIHTMPTDSSIKEKFEILSGIAKTEELRATLAQSLQDRNEDESVEVYLYYEHLLRAELKLVSAIENMRFSAFGKRDGINKETLVELVEDNYLFRLVKYPAFESLTLMDRKYQMTKKLILDFSCKELERIEKENINSSGNYCRLANELRSNTEQDIETLSIDWIKRNINPSWYTSFLSSFPKTIM